QMLEKYRESDPVRARQIELAMERLRWLPDLAGRQLIVVNLPMFHLWGWDADSADGVAAIEMAAIIGRASAGKTPVFASRVTDIVINPYWNVPDSIARNEILPKLQRDPNYLARNHMEMTSDGNVQRIRQLPGPWNSLGRIKLDFSNVHSVYLHGTPANELFSRARRDFSHGCVRVEDPVGLAEWVLSRQEGWSRPRILDAIAEGTTRTVRVAEPPHVVMFYVTAMVVAGEDDVTFAEDIYGHDARLDAWLKARTGEAR
ncbi:MAG: murein L,D-transpeptidase, partial [Acidobacteria bacterium]